MVAPHRLKGAALHVVLALVTVLMLIASSMVALSTMNLNLLNSYANGQTAQNEAEAAVNKLLYALGERQTFGASGEDEIIGRVAGEYDDARCWHQITFRRDRGVPWSVNNDDGSQSAGYFGRTVPNKTIHAFSTGYCRGQYRTIEALIERPVFPYGVAASGKVDSPKPLVVKGAESVGAFDAGDASRPGHLAANHSSAGRDDPAVRIGADPLSSVSTFISGFVQTPGSARIDDPAIVRGGIRAGYAPVKLPQITVTSFNNEEEPGVVEIMPETRDQQVLDVMYYCSHNLRFTGGLELKDAFLYVKGNLTIEGGVKGTGAIVVEGDLVVDGAAVLASSDRIALVVSGNAELRGSGNRFQGLTYSGGRLKASNLTVLGSLVVNSPDPNRGTAMLDNVQVAYVPYSMRFTARSNRSIVSQAGVGVAFMPPMGFGWVPDNDANMEWIVTSAQVTDLVERLAGSEARVEQSLNGLTFPNADIVGTGAPPEAGAVIGAFNNLVTLVKEYRATVAAVRARQDQLRRLPADDPARAGLEAEIETLQQEATRLEDDFRPKLQGFLAELYGYNSRSPSPTGGWGDRPRDVERPYDLDLNRFLPPADSLKLRYWHIFHERL